MTTKSKPHTFAAMAESLATAKVGDYVLLAVHIRDKPTRYFVADRDGDTLYLSSPKGIECSVIVAAAERTVWLARGPRNRRVVQAWTESRPREVCDERSAPDAETKGQVASLQAEVERLRSELYDVNAELVACRQEQRELDQARAEQAVRLALSERDRDECRVALGQIRRVSMGIVPGSTPLPSNTPPHAVVIEVTAALLRATTGESRRPIVVDPEVAYRRAIGQALPERMQGDGA